MRCLLLLPLFIFQTLLLQAHAASLNNPEQFFNKALGEQHLRYDQIEDYLDYLAQNSDKITRTTYGKSYQGRDLNLTIVSSAQNIADLDAIRIRHEQLNNPFATQPNLSKMPVIIWLSFAAHGNEPSGSHAALKLIHQLINTADEQTQTWLNNSVILLDVIANPDGFDDYANWANKNYSFYPPTDRQHSAHNEPWPTARGNHYLFDLNRDWLPATQTETQAKIAQYHKWKPNVLADFHEMQSDHSYFFQPGVASRVNPLTPLENIKLTEQLTQFTAKQFDQQGKLYFTKERFDDFYIGKASTYPDIQGGVGILLEQAGSLGQQIDTQFGTLTFAKTIANQFTGALSIIEAANAKRDELLNYQQSFFKQSIAQAKDDKVSGYLITDEAGSNRLNAFLGLLKLHQIQAYPLTENFILDDHTFDKKNTYWVAFNQPQYRLIKSIFSEQTEFSDHVFYDVSNWNLALAYGVKYQAVEKRLFGVKIQNSPWVEPAKQNYPVNLTANATGWIIQGQQANNYKLLSHLLKQGVTVRVLEKALKAQTSQGEKAFSAGSLLLLKTENSQLSVAQLADLIAQYPVEIHNATSLKTIQGPDLGSAYQVKLIQPKAAIVTGELVSAFEVGQIWYHFDHQLALPLSMLNSNQLKDVDLTGYTHLILASGDYNQLPKNFITQLTLWLNQGGTLITIQRASLWASQKALIENEFLTQREINLAFPKSNQAYQDQEAYLAERVISGAVFNTQLDTSHPLAMGINQPEIAIFQNDITMLLDANTPFHDLLKFSDNPLKAGYTSTENQRLIANTTALTAYKTGKGQVIAFSFDPLYRAYWHSTSQLFNNSIYFAHLINFNH
ncbi:M14 family zinc carboxypeptidase [Catenovulum sp. 2E275]|uniref:M14 family zinc carboxypeptidase n=1 Tax=Catenovulum sp. 2E275 TaxID=2980497 RepID=UPI0021D0D010|nr:M14 family zinc carboxypeptidase [Catenovulum sp. 2E275]MCU4677671.1 M14 family zinc carboxypeptidase [Catenovulum sp. 2E275]